MVGRQCICMLLLAVGRVTDMTSFVGAGLFLLGIILMALEILHGSFVAGLGCFLVAGSGIRLRYRERKNLG